MEDKLKKQGNLTLEQAIEHCMEKADCTECGKQHLQLAEWLKDYKRLKEQYEPTAEPEWKGKRLIDADKCVGTTECSEGDDQNDES